MNIKNNKKIPIYKISLDEIIKQGGYYDIHGEWNSIVQFEKYPGKLFRGRVEVFIIYNNSVYLNLYENSNYRIPGGSFDKNISNENQIYLEAKEEAKILIKNIKFTGIKYIKFFNDIKSDNKIINWDGTYNEVYIADFDKKYFGEIDSVLSDDNMVKYGKFHEIKDIYNILTEPHKKIFKYFDMQLKENNIIVYETFKKATQFIKEELYKLLAYDISEFKYYGLHFHAKELKDENDNISFGYYDESIASNDEIIKLTNYLNNILDNHDDYNIINCHCDDGIIYAKLKNNYFINESI